MKKQTLILSIVGIFSFFFLISASFFAGGVVYHFITNSGAGVAFAAGQAQVDRETGILVAGVGKGSTVDEAGIVRGDILQEVNGESVDSIGELIELSSELKEGEEIEFSVVHGDEIKILSAEFKNDAVTSLGIESCEVGFQVPKMLSEFHFSGSPGAVILEVVPDSPAEKSGLEKGDVIVSVDGEEIGSENNLAEVIGAYEPGDQVKIEITAHGDDRKEIEIVLDEHPDNPGKAYLGIRYEQLSVPNFGGQTPPFGRKFSPHRQFPFDDKMPFELPEALETGALVLEVTPAGPADDAHIQKGDVIIKFNEIDIKTPKDLVEEINALEPGNKVSLTVYRTADDDEITVEVELGEHPKESGKAYLGVQLAALNMQQSFERRGLPFGMDHLFQFDEDFSDEDLPFDFHFDLPFDIPFEDLLENTDSGENA